MNPNQYSLMLKALQLQATLADMVLATGLSRQTIAKALKALHQQQLAHICDWDMDAHNRTIVARWALGEGPDARRPGPQEPAAKQREYRRRKAMQRGY